MSRDIDWPWIRKFSLSTGLSLDLLFFKPFFSPSHFFSLQGAAGGVLGFFIGIWKEERVAFHSFSFAFTWAVVGGSFYGFYSLSRLFFFFFKKNSDSPKVRNSLTSSLTSPVTKELLEKKANLPPHDAFFYAGGITGGVFAGMASKSLRGAVIGSLSGSLLATLSILALGKLEEWRLRKALESQGLLGEEKKGEEEEEFLARWGTKIPKWLPIKYEDKRVPKEMDENEELEVEIWRLEKEIKQKEDDLMKKNEEKKMQK